MSENRPDIRLAILQALVAQPGYTANQEVLISELKNKGHLISRDKLHIELAWLDQQADALVDRVTGGVHISTLTGDGLEVVTGATEIPGIRRPRPEELPNG